MPFLVVALKPKRCKVVDPRLRVIKITSRFTDHAVRDLEVNIVSTQNPGRIITLRFILLILIDLKRTFSAIFLPWESSVVPQLKTCVIANHRVWNQTFKINEGMQTCTVRRLFIPTCSSVIVCFSGNEHFLDFFFGASLEQREDRFFVVDVFFFDDNSSLSTSWLTLSLERPPLLTRNDFMFLFLCLHCPATKNYPFWNRTRFLIFIKKKTHPVGISAF